jgi:molybdate transport system substrate-binding protein
MRHIFYGLALAGMVTHASAADLVVFGAGSLREAVGQVAQEWAAKHGMPVRTEFGPSGRMRERIERGEPVDLFTSADIGTRRNLSQTDAR